jgi:hypothetical protein
MQVVAPPAIEIIVAVEWIARVRRKAEAVAVKRTGSPVDPMQVRMMPMIFMVFVMLGGMHLMRAMLLLQRLGGRLSDCL